MHRMTVMMLFAIATLVGCNTSKTSDRDLALVSTDEALGVVGTHEATLGIGGDTVGVWVDPRSPEKFARGHIEGAINVPLRSVREDFHILDGYDILVVYGEDYDDDLAFAASKTLMELGFDDVRTLRGGLRAWESAGRSLVQD